MFINNFIYFYIGICILLILFELIWNQYIKMYNIQSRKMKIKYKEQILCVERYHEKIDTELFFKELKNANNLIAFQDAFEEIVKKRNCQDFLHQILPVFIKLNDVYANRKKEMEKAFFAYVIGTDFTINNVENANMFLETLYSFLNSSSIYCRTNAMVAIFHIGKINHVMRAIQFLNRNEIVYHNNLLARNLKDFEGNKKILAIELMKHFDEYAVNTQIAIVKFLTEYNYVLEEDMLKKLQMKGIATDVKCEIMRYFQTNKSEMAKKFLISKLKESNLVADDLIIKAIGTLGYYNDIEVREVLENLKDSNDENILEAVYRSLEKMENLILV